MSRCCCRRHRLDGQRVCVYCREHGSLPPERLSWSGDPNVMTVSLATYFANAGSSFFLIPAEHIELVEDRDA